MNWDFKYSTTFFALLVGAFALLLGSRQHTTSLLTSSNQKLSCVSVEGHSAAETSGPQALTQNSKQSAHAGTASVSSSCTMSLQLVKIDEQFIPPLSARSVSITPRSSISPSHLFVFQEPDPPRSM